MTWVEKDRQRYLREEAERKRRAYEYEREMARSEGWRRRWAEFGERIEQAASTYSGDQPF
jgi:hypothetical protein